MKHRYVGYLKQMLALFLVMCLGMSFIPEAKASPSEQSTHMLPLECQGEYTYLNVLQNKDTWLVEAEGLCAMSDCQLEQSGRKVTLSRGDTGGILYTTSLDDCVVQGEQVYLPLQDATVATGVCLEAGDPYLVATVLKVPKEFEATIESVLSDKNVALGQMQEDLGPAWTVMSTAAHAYSIMPFVNFSVFVDVLAGEYEISAYEEAFAHLLAEEGTLHSALEKVADFNQVTNDTKEVLDLAQTLIDDQGPLSEYAKEKEIKGEVLEQMVKEYPRGGYEAGLEDWLETYVETAGEASLSYVLDACTMYSAMMDAEESTMAALKATFEYSSSYSAHEACDRVLTYRYGTMDEKVSDFTRGWAYDVTSELFQTTLEKFITQGGAGANLLAVVASKAIDYMLGASDKANFTLAYETYTFVQKELRNYLYLLDYTSDTDIPYMKRATAILYIRCAMEAYEGAEFDENLEEALTNAQTLFANYLVDILSYSQEEYAPTYDNQGAIDWLNQNATTFEVENFLAEAGLLYSIERKDISKLDETKKYGVSAFYDLVTFDTHLSKYEGINRELYQDYQEYQDTLAAGEVDSYYQTAYTNHELYQYTIETTVAYQGNGLVSFLQTAHWYMGGVANKDYNGYVISLSTGEFMTLPQLTDADAGTLLGDLRAIALCCAQNNGYDSAQAREDIMTWEMDDFEFYVESGQVYLLFDTYKVGPGAAGAMKVALCQVGGIPALITQRGEVRGAASFLGHTVGEMKDYYGSKYEIGNWAGGTHIGFTDSPLFYLRGPEIQGRESYGRTYSADEINNYLTAHSIEAVGSVVLLDQLTGSMTYPELVQALGDNTELQEPEFFENMMTGEFMYSVSFAYEGYLFTYNWIEDPMTARSEGAYVGIYQE